MKKIKFLLLLFMPFMLAHAKELDEFNVEANDQIIVSDTINGSNVMAGGDITSTANVNGINMMFGNIINHKGIDDYALYAGYKIDVYGKINNDGLILGNNIAFDANVVVGRDLFIFGNTVVLKGNFERDVRIYASDIVVEEANIKGDITILGSKIVIKSNSSIEGTLSYSDKAEVSINTNVSDIKIIETPTVDNNAKIVSFLFDYAQTMVVFVVLALLLPKLFKKIDEKYDNMQVINIFSDLGLGVFAFILIPALIIVLFSTGIGILLAVLILLLYIVLICLTTILSGYLIGHYVGKLVGVDNILLIGLIGISIVKVLSIIPKLSIVPSFICVTLGLGIITRLIRK